MQHHIPRGLFLVEKALLEAEAQISLVERLTPINFEQERSLTERSLKQGRTRLPVFEYVEPDRVSLERVRETLKRSQDALSALEGSVAAALLQERVAELSLELAMVLAVGTAEVRDLSRARYPFSGDEISCADALAESWFDATSASRGSASEGPRKELFTYLQAQCQKERIKVEVVQRPLASVSAVGGEVLYVRAGAKTTEEEARRIFHHEVEGHLLPRLRSRNHPAPFSIGTPGCLEDEEGRAILLEERFDCLSQERMRTLAVRHWVASSVLVGSEVEVVLRLAAQVPSDVLSESLCRALRGGGLARERVYLPAFLRVKRALAETPELEEWMREGRISVSGARALLSAD